MEQAEPSQCLRGFGAVSLDLGSSSRPHPSALAFERAGEPTEYFCLNCRD
jgi:hypothetical protein